DDLIEQWAFWICLAGANDHSVAQQPAVPLLERATEAGADARGGARAVNEQVRLDTLSALENQRFDETVRSADSDIRDFPAALGDAEVERIIVHQLPVGRDAQPQTMTDLAAPDCDW